MGKHHSQAGSAMWFILIGIVLFAAVSAAITQSGKGNTSALLGPEKAKIYAGEIMNYATQLSGAVRRVMALNDCSDTQISFERAPFDGSDTDYVNPNAPSDFSCHVFHPNGGELSHRPANTEWLDGVSTALTDYGEFVFSQNCVGDIGAGSCSDPSINTELVVFLPYVDRDICTSLNEKVGFSSGAIPQDAINMWTPATRYTGAFTAAATRIGTSTTDGYKSLCLEGDNSPPAGTYHFYHILVAR